MLDIFRTLFTFWVRPLAYTETFLFRLHTKVTVVIHLLFFLLVSPRQFLFQPIFCSSDALQKDVLNAYCWTHITPYHAKINEKPASTPTHYQWIVVCLFLQAVFFYFPRWLWFVFEGGKVQRLKKNLSTEFEADEEKWKKKEISLQYLVSNLNTHKYWSIQYLICEALTLVNVAAQIFFINWLLRGVFWDHGTQVFDFLAMEATTRVDPMNEVFPEVTKCVFRKFAASGTTVIYDALCVLPLNLTYQKIYTFLWFWNMLLIVLTLPALLLRFPVYFSPRVRWYVMRLRCLNIRVDVLGTIVSRIRFGDWFLLYLLNKNVEPDVFKELMEDFAKKIEDRSVNEIELNLIQQ